MAHSPERFREEVGALNSPGSVDLNNSTKLLYMFIAYSLFDPGSLKPYTGWRIDSGFKYHQTHIYLIPFSHDDFVMVALETR